MEMKKYARFEMAMCIIDGVYSRKTIDKVKNAIHTRMADSRYVARTERCGTYAADAY